MTNLHLTAAFGDYEHTRDLALGRVRPQGVDLTVLNYEVEEIFFRFVERGEWEVSEMSMGMYCAAASRPDPRMVALPVFTSRTFRHGAFYVRADAGIDGPGDLAGRRIGVPQWSQTAGIYARGYLTEDAGVPLETVKWVQAGLNSPGRIDHATLALPKGIELTAAPTRTLDELLLAGEIDAIISARPPQSFLRADPRIRRLFADVRAAEAAWHRATGVFPIMHTIAIRRDVFERHRWIARNLMEAFDEARRRGVRRMMEATASYAPVPWGADHATASYREVFGAGEPWPYGVDANRTTISAFLRYCHAQGVTARQLAPEDLFPPEATATFAV